MNFEDLGLVPELLETLAEIGYAEPTPIQQQAIPPLLAGNDVMGRSQTGTGKTAAFTLPLVQQLDAEGDLQLLILTPTRELAIQVAESVYRYGNKLGVRVLPIYGQQSYDRQIRRLKKGVNVVVGTPGRTLDLLKRRALKMDEIRFVVLDEADEMLKMGFVEDLEAILGAAQPETRQTVLFSATLSTTVQKLAQQYMRDPLVIEIETQEMTVENVTQRFYMVNHQDKVPALCRILEVEDMQNVLVFSRTRAGAAELAETLIARGYPAMAIHGDLAQNERERILRRFRDGQVQILVATDVVARGVDIADVSHVINYDIPQLPIEYVHRIGRTGRAGRAGKAITLITAKERRHLRRIEDFTRKSIEKAKLPTRAEVLDKRAGQFKAQLMDHLNHFHPDVEDSMLDELIEQGYTMNQVAVALLQVIRSNETERPLEDIGDVKDAQGRERRDRSNGSDRSDGNRKPRRRKRNVSSHEEGMIRLRMDIGRSSGIKPGDIVSRVASAGKIPGKVIGAIDIFQDETFVDVPEDHVNDVLRAMKKGRIRGKSASMQRANG
ncbi:MAG: DEAD/DEAH box helicase [Anaerolineae bacterium]|nr:DEAD/DEAH box helicase [Anaerolineae bacterium]